MQRVSTRTVAEGINEGRNRFSIHLLVLILFKSCGGWGHGDQNTIETVQKADISHGVASAVDAGMVNDIAEFTKPARTCGGANNLVAQTPEMDSDCGSDVSTTNNPEAT
jgi:hypothetical protein